VGYKNPGNAAQALDSSSNLPASHQDARESSHRLLR